MDHARPAGVDPGRPGGGLTTAYARAVGAGKPVFWAEFGANVWGSPAGGRTSQGDLYTAVLAMVEGSGANGASGWWFPGGFRADEGSDFGVFDPDGTPRPAAQALSTSAQRLRGGSALPPIPDAWIDVDRDRHVQGYAGIWAAQQQAYLAQVKGGHTPGVRLPGTGTTSRNCPLTAVGGGPYPGYGPVQALNGTFVQVSVGGQPVAAGERIATPATLQVTAGNTAPAAWADDVHLVAELPGGTKLRAALQHQPVPFLGFGTFEPLQLPAVAGDVRLGLEARDGVRFGASLQVRV